MVCKYRDSLENDDEFDEMNPLYFERQPIVGITIPGESSSPNSADNSFDSLIYIYDQPTQPHPPLKLHDMIEVIGILESFPDIGEPSQEDISSESLLSPNHPRKKQKTDPSIASSLPSNSSQKSVQFDLSSEEEELLSMLSSYQPNSSMQHHSCHPSSKIHCLFYHHIPPSYPFSSSICDPNHHALRQSVRDFLTNTSSSQANQAQEITQLFSSILHDSLVSQYLTLALISSVYNRIESSHSVGNLPLNICNANSIPPVAIQELLNSIKKITPRTIEVELTPLPPAMSSSCHHHQITLDPISLENIQFGLCKDDIQNLLSPSPFQLGQHTVIVIHEKNLLNFNSQSEKAQKNLETLRNLIFHQRILVDFNYYHLELPVNYPVVILSDQPSYFTSEKLISIKYHPNHDQFPSPSASPPFNPLQAHDEEMTASSHKIWWSKCLEVNNSIQTNPELVQRIEDDYVNFRQETAEQENARRFLTNPDDLHNSLTLTRLYAVSCHSPEILLSHWEYVLYLEEARSMRTFSK
jgi:hypothetical protein